MGGSFHGYVSHNQRVTRLISVIELFKYIDLIDLYGYESIPINTIFRGMNIHLPAILMWTTGVQGFDPLPYWFFEHPKFGMNRFAAPRRKLPMCHDFTSGCGYRHGPKRVDGWTEVLSLGLHTDPEEWRFTRSWQRWDYIIYIYIYIWLIEWGYKGYIYI